jgi:hypothetical protein
MRHHAEPDRAIMADPDPHSPWNGWPTGLLAVGFIALAWLVLFLIWQGVALLLPG